MSTKQSPGPFDCFKAALPDEPIFVILGRDPAGPATLDKWAHERIVLGKNVTPDDRERLREAINQATEMSEWRARMLEASVDGVPPWRLPMSFVTDDTKPVCVLQPDEAQDARIVASGLRQDARALRTVVNENNDWIGSLKEPLLDLVDSISSRAAMLDAATVEHPEFIGYNQDATFGWAGPKDGTVGVTEYREGVVQFGRHRGTVAEITSKLDRLHDLENPKPLYWANAREVANDEDGTPIKMLSAVRVSELLDYATCYGEFDLDTPNGTKSKYGDQMTNPMNDLRRLYIHTLKLVLGLVPEGEAAPPVPELEEVARRQESGKRTVGVSPALGAAYQPSERHPLLKLLDETLAALDDGRRPTPYNLYRAVKTDVQVERANPWSYEALDLGVSDLRKIRGMLADPYDSFAKHLQNYRDAATEIKMDGLPVIDTAANDLAHSPEVPIQRFAHFHKSGSYAYAKGLEVNPIHLPVALDEMEKDGWHLVCMFGATDSKHVGFIFRRKPEPVLIMPGDMLGEADREDIAAAAERDRGRGLEP